MFVAVVIYAGLTAWQAFLTQAALKNSKDQFRAEQRPYVFLISNAITLSRPPIIVPVGEHKGQMMGATHFSNYGRSPAIDVTEDAHIAIGDKECSELEGDAITDEHGTMVAPGDTSFFNFAYSRTIPTEEMIKSIVAGDIPVAVFGHFEYTDTHPTPKVTYLTEFCVMPYVTPDKMPSKNYCREHNGIGQRQPY